MLFYNNFYFVYVLFCSVSYFDNKPNNLQCFWTINTYILLTEKKPQVTILRYKFKVRRRTWPGVPFQVPLTFVTLPLGPLCAQYIILLTEFMIFGVARSGGLRWPSSTIISFNRETMVAPWKSVGHVAKTNDLNSESYPWLIPRAIKRYKSSASPTLITVHKLFRVSILHLRSIKRLLFGKKI